LPDVPEAAFPTPELAVIHNYTRVARYVALAGKPGDGGVDAAAAAGFTTIIDLRQPDEEGVTADVTAAALNHLDHYALPMPSEPEKAEAFMARLSLLLDDAANYPILLHCGSANRAAAAWALYRARGGTDPFTALEEARAAGLTSREPFVRTVLGLPEMLESGTE
jgi:uncharacterized protein (TIGR01244 family)